MMGCMVDPRYKKHISAKMPFDWYPFDGDGYVLDELIDIINLRLDHHPEYVSIFDAHRDQTVVGMRRTAAALDRRGWRLAQPGEDAWITGWASMTLAGKHEIDHAWLSPASCGVIARIAAGEPVFEDLSDERHRHLRPSRVLRFDRKRIMSDFDDPYVRLTGRSFAFFGDQDAETRLALANTEPVEIAGSSRWRTILADHAAGRLVALPEMPIPPGSRWATAIERMLLLEGKGTIVEPDLDGRLDAIAEQHEAIARDEDGWAAHGDLGPGRDVVMDILRDGGRDDVVALMCKRRAYGEDVALVHSALGMEAAALARSVRQYRFQKA